MELFTAVGDNDPGEWFVYAKDGDVQFKLRRLPGSKAREIDYRATGRVMKVGQDGVKHAKDKGFDSILLQALWCMVDTKNFEVRMGASDEVAQAYAAAVGTNGIKPGDVLKLDGKWNDQLKRLVFEDWVEGLRFIGEKVKKMSRVSDEEEEDALGN